MWMTIAAASTFTLVALLGVALTAMTLPGLWLPIVGAAIWEIAFPDTFSWWTIGACALLCLGGEAVEFFGAAHGAAKSGGGRPAAWGATIGSIIGAILGSIVLPIIGTIIGAVGGAAIGALSAERGIAEKNWRQSLASASGAAKGRALALMVKVAIAGAVGVAILIDAAI